MHELVVALALSFLGPIVRHRPPAQDSARVPIVSAAVNGATAVGGLLAPNSAIELWHEGKLCVGNFKGRVPNSKNALAVELSCGRTIKIDGGQIIDVWESVTAPSSAADWVPVHEQASTLLTELPPHMLDLRPLWQRLFTEKKKARVDSAIVARELFRSPHAEMARTRQPPKADTTTLGLAERLAAAQLLAEERTLFKRQPVEVTGVTPPPSTVAESAAGDDAAILLREAGESLRWCRGGFKALPKAQASSRAELVLIDAMKARLALLANEKEEAAAALVTPATLSPPAQMPLNPKKFKVAELKEELGKLGLPTAGNKPELLARLQEALAAAPAEEALAAAPAEKPAAPAAGTTGSVWPTAILPLLAEVELVALGLSGVRKQIERVLTAFEQPTDAAGAKALLLAVGQWNEDVDDSLVKPVQTWVDPFPREALAEGAIAAARTVERRVELARLSGLSRASPPAAERGKPWWLAAASDGELNGGCEVDVSAVDDDPYCAALDGRVDLRGRCARAFAIDTDSTDFRDDAISYDPKTATLAVHICDMNNVVPAGSLLDDVARLRLQTIYSGSMPLHMLPPPLLRECALSPTRPNECLSALLQLDAFGRVRHARLVRSIIPPVRILSYQEVEALLTDRSISSDVITEIRGLAAITRRRAESRSAPGGAGSSKFTPPTSDGVGADAAPPDAGAHKPAAVRWRQAAGDGSWRPEIVPRGHAHTLVDEALAMFSYAARGAAKRHNLLRLPQTEHHRIATAPLRRYADLIAQRQLSAALQGQPGMPASEVAAVERWVRQKQSDLAQQQRSRPQPQLLRALEAHCARQATATGAGFAVLDGIVSKALSGPFPRGGGGGGRGGGRGGRGSGGNQRVASLEVRLEAAGGVAARAMVRTPNQHRAASRLQVGQPVRVRLRSVDAQRGTVDVELTFE